MIDFSPTETQQAVRRLFADFADSKIRPVAAQLDQSPRFPRELFRQVGELGLYGLRYPTEDGPAADGQTYAIAVEELARGSLGVAATCVMQSLMGSHFIHRFARGDVRDRLVDRVLAGELVATICMTEPDAGSDLLSMSTKAERSESGWRLTGQKTWITSAPVADLFTVFAKTGDRQLSVFLVDRGADGLVVGRAIEKMGVRASLTSEVSFEDTPAMCMLGEPGQGTASLREILSEIRVATGAMAVGVARAAFDDALAYAQQRTQFGKPICKLGAIQHHLAEMRVDIEGARRLVEWAAWRGDQRLPNQDESAMAKLFASEAAVRVCDRAARIMASYGFATDYAVERYLRDVRFMLIGGGTSEVLRVNIAKGLSL